MSDSYSFLTKNFVLSECKGTKKCETGDFPISHFLFIFYLVLYFSNNSTT